MRLPRWRPDTPYRRINEAQQTPKSFSRVFAQFAMFLNDNLPNDQRQMLVPFLTRMEGSRDNASVEMQRAMSLLSASGSESGSWKYGCGCPSCQKSGTGPGGMLNIVSDAAIAFLRDPDMGRIISAFDAAMKIGNRASPLDSYLVADRIEKVKRDPRRFDNLAVTDFSGPAHPYAETANYSGILNQYLKNGSELTYMKFPQSFPKYESKKTMSYDWVV